MRATLTFITSPFEVLFSLYILSTVFLSAENLSSPSRQSALSPIQKNNATVTERYFNEHDNVSFSRDKMPSSTATKKHHSTMQVSLESSHGWDPSNPASNIRYKTAIDSLPTSIRKAVLNHTGAYEIEESDLLLLDSISFAIFQKQFREILTDKQLMVVLETMLDKQRFRQAAQVLERIGSRLAHQPDALTSLMKAYSFSQEKRCMPDVQTFIRQGLRLLLPPEKWNWTVVRKLGLGVLAALPLDLIMRIQDPQASALVLDEWLSTSADFFGCSSIYNPSAQARFWINHITDRRKAQVKLMYSNLGEDVKKWSPAALNRYGSLLPYLTPRILRLIDGRIVIESASALSSLKDLEDGQGYALVENLATTNSTGLIAENSAGLGYAMSRLGSLRIYLLPEYLNLSVRARLNILPIWAEKMDRWVDDVHNFPKWTASALLQYRLLSLENNGSILSLQKLFGEPLSASFIQIAPWKYFKLFLNQSSAVNLSTIDVLNKLSKSLASGNSLLASQVNRLKPFAIQRFRREKIWDIKNTPWIYWGGASFSDWTMVSGREIGLLLDRINLAAKHMKLWQLAMIYKKLEEDNCDFGDLKNAQVIKALAPVHQLNIFANSESLKRMAADMPPESIIGLMYSSIKLREGFSAEGLINDRFLCSNVDLEFLESMPLHQIPFLLEILSTLPHGPSIQTVRALHDRLKLFTKYLNYAAHRPDVMDNDASLLENTWISSFNEYPGYVIAWYSVEAVQAIAPAKKIELLRSIGRLSMLDYYSIPKKVRLTILEHGLSAMGKLSEGWLGEEELAVLGIALVDLSREALERILPRAFEHSLPLLQGEAEIYEGLNARPCLTIEQRSAVRSNLKRVFRSPSSWNYGIVRVACCSLDTLSELDLDAIRDDLILVSCQGCAADDEPLLHLQHLRQRIETACLYEIGSKELEDGLLSGKERLTKRRARAAMRTYRNGRVRIIGVNDQLFNRDQNIQLNCDMILASGSVAGFTVDELMTLSDEDVQDCLYEMGLSQLSLEQATAIFSRILQVYKNPNFIPKEQIKKLGWVLTALNESMIENLNLESEDVLAELGSDNWKLSQKQMETLARNAFKQYGKNASEFTGMDLMLFGRLLCGMNASLIDRVPTLSYVQASVSLGVILGKPGWCSSDVLFAFGRKAIQTSAFGPPFLWTAAVLKNVGAVIGGLSPEELRAIPSRSMRGLTPTSVTSIDPNHFKAFKQEQLLNFPLAAAQAVVAADHSYGLIEEMRNALNYVIFANTNSGSSVVGSLGNVVVFTCAVIFSMAVFYPTC